MTEDGDFERLLVALGRHAVLIAIVAIIAGAVAFVISATQSSQYRGTSKVLYNPSQTTANGVTLDPTRAMSTLVELAKTEPVLDLARQKMPPARRSTLGTRTSVTAAANQDLLNISVTAGSADAAASDSRAVTTAFIQYWSSAQKQSITARLNSLRQQLQALAGRTTPSAVSAAADLRTQIAAAAADLATTGSDLIEVQPATPPSGRFSPHPYRNLLIGLLAGAIFGGILAVVRERVDRHLRTVGEVEDAYPVSVLGTVPRVDEAAHGRRSAGFADFAATTPIAEAYRTIRTNLDIVNGGSVGGIVVVTSAVPAEGKSAVSANLAAALVQTGRNVLAISADLRSPSLHEYFQLKASDGLAEVLAGDARVERAAKLVDSGMTAARANGRLSLLSSSRRVIDPAFLFQSQAMSRLIDEAEEKYDVVVIDTVPLLSAPEAAILAARADAVVLVAALRVATRADARRSLQILEVAGAKAAGVVVTGGNPWDIASYGYSTS